MWPQLAGVGRRQRHWARHHRGAGGGRGGRCLRRTAPLAMDAALTPSISHHFGKGLSGTCPGKRPSAGAGSDLFARPTPLALVCGKAQRSRWSANSRSRSARNGDARNVLSSTARVGLAIVNGRRLDRRRTAGPDRGGGDQPGTITSLPLSDPVVSSATMAAMVSERGTTRPISGTRKPQPAESVTPARHCGVGLPNTR